MNLRAHVIGNGVELRNVHMEVLTADPAGLVAADIGRYWYRSDLGRVRLCIAAATVVSLRREDVTIVNADIDAAAAIAYSKLNLAGSIVNADISGAAAIALSKLAVDPLARANHTGTQLASTISNFDTQVRTSRIDQMAQPTAVVNHGGQRLTNLGDASGNTDAVNLGQLSAVAAGHDYKESSYIATVGTGETYTIAAGSVTAMTGLPAGTTLGMLNTSFEPVVGSRVLVKNAPAATGAGSGSAGTSSTQPANGIYVVTGGTTTSLNLTRATDADASAEVSTGMTTFVENGNEVGQWTLLTAGAITVATTAVQFAKTGNASPLAATLPLFLGGVGNMTVGLNIAAPLGIVSGTTLGITGVLALLNGGTGSSTAAGARTNLGAPGTKGNIIIGDGAATTFTITQATHGLRADDQMIVAVYDITANPSVQIFPDVSINSVNGTVTVSGFLTAPATNTIRVVIVG